ncbi:hypothetical protein BS78_08G039600 [Paspalum vaginatum]|nr:hypothetical protein BS78_08G039600 [Paspalum vaginatum]
MMTSMAPGEKEHGAPEATARAVVPERQPPRQLDGAVLSAPLAAWMPQLLSVAVSSLDPTVPRKMRSRRRLPFPRPRPSAWWDLKLPVVNPLAPSVVKNPTEEEVAAPRLRSRSQRLRVHQEAPPPDPDMEAEAPPAETARRCVQCGTRETPKWRSGSMGLGTLCNACGLRPAAEAPRVAARSTDVPEPEKPPPPQESVLPVPDPESPPESPIWEPALELDVYLLKRKSRKTASTPAQLEKEKASAKWCLHCGSTSTPRWRREGPQGRGTLCNACGVKYARGRLLPEYRPLASPTFKPSEHASRHTQVLKLRQRRQRGRKGKNHRQPATPAPEQQQATTDDDLMGEGEPMPSSPSLDLQFLLGGPSAPMIVDGDDDALDV